MKITAITTEEYKWPRHKPISNGVHTYTHTGLELVIGMPKTPRVPPSS